MEEEIIQIEVEALALDCTIVQVHPDGTEAEQALAAAGSRT